LAFGLKACGPLPWWYSWAAKAGLKAGDRITGLAGKPVKGIPDFVAVIKGLRKGDTIEVCFVRDDKELAVKAKLE
jgi:S1-C subfamily serine protease